MTQPESREVFFLRQVEKQKYSADFVQNLSQVNTTLTAVSKYLIGMQKGIDEANQDFIQKIQAFIDEIIIIFTGGEIGGDTGFEWGDLGYIISALGALFGFQGMNGPINLFEAAAHLLQNFGEAIINIFIRAPFEFFASLLSNVPFVGEDLSEIVLNIADGLNLTHGEAQAAYANAEQAQIAASNAEAAAEAAGEAADEANTAAGNAASQAQTAYLTAQEAQQVAENQAAAVLAAQNAASAAATDASLALEKAEVAYENAQYDSIQFSVSTSGVVNGKNEEVQGVLLLVPSNRIMKITRVIYTLATNTGTLTVQLIKKLPAGGESVIFTTTINPSGTLMKVDVDIDYEVTDLDRYLCNVTVNSGQQTGLYCTLETALLEVA